MRRVDLPARVILVAGGLAVAAALSSCSTSPDRPSETVPPTPGSSTATQPPATPSPTEKRIPTLDPTGPNSFTPPITARPAPTALPGNVRGGH